MKVPWSLSQWVLFAYSVLGLFGGLTIAMQVQLGVWPPAIALAGFATTVGAFVGLLVLAWETSALVHRAAAEPLERGRLYGIGGRAAKEAEHV